MIEETTPDETPTAPERFEASRNFEENGVKYAEGDPLTPGVIDIGRAVRLELARPATVGAAEGELENDEEADELAALQERAEALGVTTNARWGLPRWRSEVAAAEAAAETNNKEAS